MQVATATDWHPDLIQSLCVLPYAEELVRHRSEEKQDIPQIARGLCWNQLQQITAQYQLTPYAVVPVLGADEVFLGVFLLLTPAHGELAGADRQTLLELSALAAFAMQCDNDRRKLHDAEVINRHYETSMARMALAIEGSGTGIWDRNIVTGEIHYSPGWKAILGYADHEISHRIEDSYTRLHPDDLPYVQQTIKAHFEGKTSQYAVEHRVRCKDGSYKWISSRGRVVSRDADGNPLRMIGTTTDISAMRALSEQLQQSVDLVTSLTNEVPGLAYQYQVRADGQELFSYLSEGVREIFELAPEQLRENAAVIHQLIHPDDLPRYQSMLKTPDRNVQHVYLEFRVNLPRQGLRWRQMSARPRHLPDGSIVWHGLITDVTEHKRIETTLHEMATIDFLTQIPNRRYFMGRMEEELARIKRGVGKPSAVMMYDLDNFKLINDNYGHAVGDIVLRHFAGILKEQLRKNDTAGRVGGEEFAVILSGTNLDEAEVFARRVQQQLLNSPVKLDHVLIHVTVSIGISMILPDDIGPDAALTRSDTALYLAKENGRNRITLSS
ncbi:MAG: diguanylate cyclase [Burkholderiales bacterium]|nr:diguanylate cyclase [Burkholderiales bacterium]